jgi:hypothetical protein
MGITFNSSENLVRCSVFNGISILPLGLTCRRFYPPDAFRAPETESLLQS